jgi:hypothetical protein
LTLIRAAHGFQLISSGRIDRYAICVKPSRFADLFTPSLDCPVDQIISAA